MVDILFNAMFMPSMGATGAAIATLIAEFVQMSIQVYFSRKLIFKEFRIKSIVNPVVGSIIAGVSIYALRGILNYNSFINLLITGIVFFLVYFIILFILKEKTILEILDFLKKRRTTI